LSGVARPCGQSPGSCHFHRVPEVRPLPSPSITWFPRYYEPVRHPAPARPVPRGRPVGSTTHRWGFPCCVRSPCTDMPSPLPRWDRSAGSFRSPEACGFGLPRVFGGSAPTLVFSRPAQRSRVLRPACSRHRLAALSIEGFDDFVTSIVAPIATGWSKSCRVGIAPTEDRRLSTAHKDSRPLSPPWNKQLLTPRFIRKPFGAKHLGTMSPLPMSQCPLYQCPLYPSTPMSPLPPQCPLYPPSTLP
jgi:hypothetical protein